MIAPMPDKTERRRPIVLMPHQKMLKRHLSEMRFPFYIYWGMGSGKTIGGCICMQLLKKGERGLVICDKTCVEQWKREVGRFLECNHADFAEITVDVFHYESLDQSTGCRPNKYAMVVVDEAHRFRNAWDKESKRMLSWMHQIKSCNRVVFMSGTPIVHDETIEMNAFTLMMKTGDGCEDVSRRLSYYDPRLDQKQVHHYASTDDRLVGCPMTWAQCFVYMQSRKQTFALHIKGEPEARVRISSQRNTYNTLLRSICNVPFSNDSANSPKMMHMMHWMSEEEKEGVKQVVYSSRKDTGVFALLHLWKSVTKFPKFIFQIDGSMSQTDRGDQILKFNRCVRAGILFITDAASQGVDLKRVHAMHIMEPADNMQEERQIINRAIRFKAHREKSAIVRVYRYISTFPSRAGVEPPWKTVIADSGLFDPSELNGITRKVQRALLQLIADEEAGMTIDQKTLIRRDEREQNIQRALKYLQGRSIEQMEKECDDIKNDRPISK